MTLLLLVVLGACIGLVLGGLGGGGAILTVPALVFLVGQDAAAATTSSLVIVGTAALTGAASHVRSGRVDWRTGLTFGVAGIPAAWGGSHLSHVVDGDVLLLGFSVLMLLAASGMLRRPAEPGAEHGEELGEDSAAPADAHGIAADGTTALLARPETRRTGLASLAPVVGVGLVVGFLTGFFGVGGGFVIVPALVLVLALPMQLAVGTSLVIVALNSATSLVARSATAQFDWGVIVPFALAAMVATVLGRRVADSLPAAQLRRGFAVLLVLVAGYTIWQSLTGLLA